jgi:hypothetical protein
VKRRACRGFPHFLAFPFFAFHLQTCLSAGLKRRFRSKLLFLLFWNRKSAFRLRQLPQIVQ